MQDLLLHRFRGALRGAIVGEAAAAANRFTWAQVRSGNWLPSAQQWPQSRLLLAAVEQTIAQALHQPSDQPADSPLAFLPIALFFHENPLLLRQQIDRLRRSMDEIEQASILALSGAIALALREELLPNQLLPRLSKEVASVSLSVAEQLMQVQFWLEAEVSWAAVARSIAVLHPSIARLSLALYGWLSTPTDFNLSLLRTQGSSAAIWVGALSGANNGMSGIAIDWWQPLAVSEAHQIWQAEIIEPIDQLANQLLAAWAGADAIDRESAHQAAIAAAGLIRPR